MEHSHLGLDGLSQLILAARATGVDTVVRIPKGPYNQVIKPLELGGRGIGLAPLQERGRSAGFCADGQVPAAGLARLGLWPGFAVRYAGLPTEYMGGTDAETILGVMIEGRPRVWKR